MEPIRIQSFVAATPAEVWAALLGRPEVVLDALPEPAWPEQRDERPPSHLVARWPYTEPCGGVTDVAIALEEVFGGTLVDLRHGGWGEGPTWVEALAGHFAGWLQALAALGLLVETGKDARPSAEFRGRERYFASAEIRATADAVYRSLVDPLVLREWGDGVLDGVRLVEEVEGRYVRWGLPGREGVGKGEGEERGKARGTGTGTGSGSGTSDGELVMILRRTPRGTHCALAEYGVTDRETASRRWPPMFEKLARFLS